MSQIEMFTPPTPKLAVMPTAESVRPRLESVLRQLRDGSATNWPDAERRRWSVVFPQMCEWLPEAERKAKREEFSALWSSQQT